MNKIHTQLIKQASKPRLAVLIDPDKFDRRLVPLAVSCNAAYFLVGGSEITSGNFERTIAYLKKHTPLPVLIFPGDLTQISAKADAILFLSLLSGRNPEYLVDIQVRSAPLIRKKKLESISTAYILIDGGTVSATQRVSNTRPIPAGNIKLATATAMAGEMMGMKLVYLEAGSGAKKNVPVRLIREVKKNISVPLIVGGGISSRKQVMQVIEAGADIVVVGNALEKNSDFLHELKTLFA